MADRFSLAGKVALVTGSATGIGRAIAVALAESGADVACHCRKAGDASGASYIKNLKGPFPQIKMVPTGGVSLTTAADFIKAGAAALGVGTDLVDVKAIREGNPEIVTERARQFVQIVKDARG